VRTRTGSIDQTTTGRYRVRLSAGGRRLTLGVFDSLDEARAARADAIVNVGASASNDPAPLGLRVWQSPSCGGIYFLLAPLGEMPIKIGLAENIARRVAGLDCMSPWPLVLVGALREERTRFRATLESTLHARFESYRVRGEWFSPGARLLSFLRGLR